MIKKSWHRIENKSTGEVQIVASLQGIDLKQFKATKIKGNRPPSEFQVVRPDGSLETDKEAKEQAKLASLSFEERVSIEVQKVLGQKKGGEA